MKEKIPKGILGYLYVNSYIEFTAKKKIKGFSSYFIYIYKLKFITLSM